CTHAQAELDPLAAAPDRRDAWCCRRRGWRQRARLHLAHPVATRAPFCKNLDRLTIQTKTRDGVDAVTRAIRANLGHPNRPALKLVHYLPAANVLACCR